MALVGPAGPACATCRMPGAVLHKAVLARPVGRPLGAHCRSSNERDSCLHAAMLCVRESGSMVASADLRACCKWRKLKKKLKAELRPPGLRLPRQWHGRWKTQPHRQAHAAGRASRRCAAVARGEWAQAGRRSPAPSSRTSGVAHHRLYAQRGGALRRARSRRAAVEELVTRVRECWMRQPRRAAASSRPGNAQDEPDDGRVSI